MRLKRGALRPPTGSSVRGILVRRVSPPSLFPLALVSSNRFNAQPPQTLLLSLPFHQRTSRVGHCIDAAIHSQCLHTTL